jgi:hypothetical protein
MERTPEMPPLVVSTMQFIGGLGDDSSLIKSRLRKSEQVDKWSFCLTAGTLVPANQERR